MTVSSIRTVVYAAPQPNYPLKPLVWLPKQARDDLIFALELSAWLADINDTIASIQVSSDINSIYLANAAFSGSLCTVEVAAGNPNISYTVYFIVYTTGGYSAEFPVTLSVLPGSLLFPTSPVMLLPGVKWLNKTTWTLPIVPVWTGLPTIAPSDKTAFYWNNNVLSIAPDTPYLPSSATGLALGDLWNNGGVVMCNGNPGLPTYSATHGILLYNGGTLTLS